jgi:hypothetical protein
VTLENRIEKLENLLALNTRFNELERNIAISMQGRDAARRSVTSSVSPSVTPFVTSFVNEARINCVRLLGAHLSGGSI